VSYNSKLFHIPPYSAESPLKVLIFYVIVEDRMKCALFLLISHKCIMIMLFLHLLL
jgi:hypothetical protein